MTPVSLEPAVPRSRVKHSTTEPPRSQKLKETNRIKYLHAQHAKSDNDVMIYAAAAYLRTVNYLCVSNSKKWILYEVLEYIYKYCFSGLLCFIGLLSVCYASRTIDGSTVAQWLSA